MYSLSFLDPIDVNCPRGIREVAEAMVIHANFIGTGPASNEAVLMEILKVSVTLCKHSLYCTGTNYLYMYMYMYI